MLIIATKILLTHYNLHKSISVWTFKNILLQFKVLNTKCSSTSASKKYFGFPYALNYLPQSTQSKEMSESYFSINILMQIHAIDALAFE